MNGRRRSPLAPVFSAGLVVACLVSCGAKTFLYAPDPKARRSRPAIVFVPGFYGTALADAESGERYFLTAWKAAFSSTPLALSQPDLGIEGARDLRPDGVLGHLRIIPGVYSKDIYGDALDFLQERFSDRADIVPFAYDWRQDIVKTVGKLDRLVKSLESSGHAPIFIVAHSMGGLVTAYYLRYGGQDLDTAKDDSRGAKHIAAAVIAGAPFGGAPIAYRNLQMGTSLGPAKTPLNALSLGTFPSMYQLAPGANSPIYRNPGGEAVGKRALRPEFWKDNRLGLFRRREPVSNDVQSRREQVTAQYLVRAETFNTKMLAISRNGHPEKTALLYLVGTGIPTLSQLLWSKASLLEKGEWLFSDQAMKQSFPQGPVQSLIGDGDGTVPIAAAAPPPGLLQRLPGKLVRDQVEHESMFSSTVFLRAIEDFLDPLLPSRGRAVSKL